MKQSLFFLTPTDNSSKKKRKTNKKTLNNDKTPGLRILSLALKGHKPKSTHLPSVNWLNESANVLSPEIFAMF